MTEIDIGLAGIVLSPELCVNGHKQGHYHPTLFCNYCSKSRTPEVWAVAWMLTKRVDEMM